VLADRSFRRITVIVWLLLIALIAAPRDAAAYIGPGAGFALLSSFFGLVAAFVLGVLALLRWPFRLVRNAWRRGGKWRGVARVRRIIIIGFDGQDPQLTDEALAAGELPHFAALAARGCYHRLRTTCPPVSPVAWSSFATGTNPGRHGIFDFLTRDPRTYLPLISSTRLGRATRVLRIGSYRIPIQKPDLQLLRRSMPFWNLLGEAGIWSTVLRVPITFPPDRFHGAQLSAMAAPDLLGTQGTFHLYTTRAAVGASSGAGVRVPLAFSGDRAETRITGPGNPLKAGEPPMEIPMRVVRAGAARSPRAARSARAPAVSASDAADASASPSGSVTIELPGQRIELTLGVLTDWIPIAFRAAPFVKVRGLVRMQLTELGEHVSIYMSPISFDPSRPAMPISHPAYYAPYLAARIGPFSTLGLAEDTGALNEGVIDEETFLRQTWDIDAERQRMFFAALDRLREGTLTCVFDATDRVQHMFWRQRSGSVGNSGADNGSSGGGGGEGTRRDAIREQYRRNDAFLGEVAARLRDGDLLMVLSDHGFNAFRRGVNLNRWLLDHGYLALKADREGRAEWLEDIDWSRTRAYALGLTGIFLNINGREAHGIVEPGAEAARVKAELIAGLTSLLDTDGAADREVSADRAAVAAIKTVHDARQIYDGPYVDQAPDLIVGYARGYRVSWECASGAVAGPLFEDNVKAWSGDHCIDPSLVPGVFFCSQPIARDDPALIDIAPTALTLFGLDVPRHMQGRPLFTTRVRG
jgi:predicted AlkP superfamily phosphohydrolase/phosphomutase